jgi:hypothetical protein
VDSFGLIGERDYLTCLPLWLRHRLQLFQEVSNMEVIFHPTCIVRDFIIVFWLWRKKK